MPDDNEKLKVLCDAVARNAAAVLSLPSAGLVRHHRTRFLGDCEQGIWIEMAHGTGEVLKDIHAKHGAVAVSFNNGTRRISFISSVTKIDPSFSINSHTRVPAALVRRPPELKGAQRRNAYRVSIRQDSDLRVRIWVIPEHAHISDRPQTSQEIKFELCDISTGGIGIRVHPNPTKPVGLVADQRLRLLLVYYDIELVIEGRLRTALKGTATHPQRSGINFKKLEADVEGRQKLAALTRIVGQLQREEVRQIRIHGREA